MVFAPVLWGFGLFQRYQFLRFLVVGGINTFVGYGIIFFAMYALHLGPEISNMIGYAVGLIVSYLLHKYVTFQSREYSHSQLVRFLVGFGVAYATNLVFLALLVRVWGVHPGLSQVFAGTLYVVVSYIMNKIYVFKSLDSTPPK